MQQFERWARTHHECLPVFVGAEHEAVVGPRRSREGPPLRESLLAVVLLARAGVVAGHQPAVGEHVEFVAVDERSGVVGRGIAAAPGDRDARVCAVGEREVATRPGMDRPDRPRAVEHEARTHEEQPVGRVGGGDRDRGATGEFPEQAAVERVRPRLAGAGRDEFRPHAVLPDEGRGPVALLVAGHSPGLAARLRVERRHEGVVFVVVHHVEPAAVQHGRGRRPPARPHRPRPPPVLPHTLAFHVEADDTDARKRGVDPLAVGDGRLRGVGVLHVHRAGGRAAGDHGLPAGHAGGGVEAGDHPANLAVRNVGPLAAEVEALLGVFGWRRRDRGGDDHTLARDDGRRPAPPVECRAPADVFRGGPSRRQLRVVGCDSPRARSPEARPVGRQRGRHAAGDCQEQSCSTRQSGHNALLCALTGRPVRWFEWSVRKPRARARGWGWVPGMAVADREG